MQRRTGIIKIARMENDMQGYEPSNLAKAIFLALILIPCFATATLFENEGFQAAGRVFSTILFCTASLFLFYYDYSGKSWFKFCLFFVFLLGISITLFSMRIERELDGRMVIPIGLLYYIIIAGIVEVVGRHFEGHSL